MEGRGAGGAVGDTPDEVGGRAGGRGGRFGSGFRPSGDTPLVKNGINLGRAAVEHLIRVI